MQWRWIWIFPLRKTDAIPNMVRICFPSFLPSCGHSVDYLTSVEDFYSRPYVGNEVGKITHHSSGEIQALHFRTLASNREESACFFGGLTTAMHVHLVCIFTRLAPAKQSYHMSLEGWTEKKILEFLSPFPEINITGKCWTQVLARDGKSHVHLGHVQRICESHGIYTSLAELKAWKGLISY